MKSGIIFMFTLLVVISSTRSQSNLGSRLTAMGNVGAALADNWSTNANPALLTETKTIIAALNYQKPIGDIPLSDQAFSFVIPFKKSAFGFFCHRYGLDDYHEIRVGVMLSKKFGQYFSLSIRGNYHQIKITNYGVTSMFSADVGLAFFLNPMVTIGFYFNNISFEKYEIQSSSNIQTSKFHLGIAYAFTDRIIVSYNLNCEKAIIENSLGMEYQFDKKLYLRAGLSTNPINKFIGLGISLKKLTVDLAIVRTAFQSYAPQIGLSYAF